MVLWKTCGLISSDIAPCLALERLRLVLIRVRLLQRFKSFKFISRLLKFLLKLDLLHLVVSEGIFAPKRFDLPFLPEWIFEYTLGHRLVFIGLISESNKAILSSCIFILWFWLILL
jgi:hypothetical protein